MSLNNVTSPVSESKMREFTKENGSLKKLAGRQGFEP